MGRDVIVACDFPGAEETMSFLSLFREEKPFVKIGMELFYSAGPDIVKKIKNAGHSVFLDLKLHDIPNTVKSAMKVLSSLEADMVNLHAAGGSNMMRAAIEGLTRPDGTRPLLIAVTQLTSTDAETLKKDILIDKPLDHVVISYARTARDCGLNGVVCSPLEAASVKTACGEGFLTVTPGVRFSGSEKQDQSRVTTPARARELKSDYIVIGRPVTRAEDPVSAYRRCMEEFVL